jgi:hypothetical protein
LDSTTEAGAGRHRTAGYTRLTHGTELIEFDSTDFALAASGINLTAEVRDKPVLLFGINTRFRFHDTRPQRFDSIGRCQFFGAGRIRIHG